VWDNMIVTPFSVDKHLDDLNSLQSMQCVTITPAEGLPQIGCVAIDEELGVIAMGFLRRVEGGQAIIDNLISNPEQSSKIRDEAIDLVAKTLLYTAKAIGITLVIANSKDENTIKRSEKFGLMKLPHTTLAVNLKHWSI
jgi:hypothetical protein